MGSNGAAVKSYIRSVSDALPCGRKAKRQIVSQISDSIEDYLQENPDADFKMLQSHFGTPQEIAVSYVNEQDTAILLEKLGIKKKVLTIVTGAVVAIVLVWVASIAWITVQAENDIPEHIEVIIENNNLNN